MYHCYLAQFEPKKVEEALKDENWVESMHQELHQFVRNDVWELVPRPKDTHVIGTSGSSRTKLMRMVKLFETNLDWWLKDILKLKV